MIREQLSTASPRLFVASTLSGIVAVLRYFWLASLLVTALYPYNEWTIALSAVLAIAGHIFPVWLKFRGGKGVATGIGAFFLLIPTVVVGAIVIFVVVFVLTRHVSLASIVSIGSIALAMCVMTLVDPLWLPFAVATILGAGLIIFAHRENIRRLRSGTEPKFE